MRHLPIRMGVALCLAYLMAAAGMAQDLPTSSDRYLRSEGSRFHVAAVQRDEGLPPWAPSPVVWDEPGEPAADRSDMALPDAPSPSDQTARQDQSASQLSPGSLPPTVAVDPPAPTPNQIDPAPVSGGEGQEPSPGTGGQGSPAAAPQVSTAASSSTPTAVDQVLEPVKENPASPPSKDAHSSSPGSASPSAQGGQTAADQPRQTPRQLGPLFRLPTEQREVVLTIDDGPSVYTAEILAVLAKEEVPAVFFWLTGGGKFPHAADLIAGGHQLGTHTISHPALPTLERAAIQSQLADSKAVLEQASQSVVQLFRPPYGQYDQSTLEVAQSLELSTVLWDVDSRDWALADRPEEILTNVMQQVKPGSIILIHERKQTLAVLPELIRSLKAAGYSFRLMPTAVQGK